MRSDDRQRNCVYLKRSDGILYSNSNSNCFPPAFEFWTTAEAANDVVKGAKIQIPLNVYAQKRGSKQIRNLAPFSTSLPTSAEECQKFKISPPHFEI